MRIPKIKEGVVFLKTFIIGLIILFGGGILYGKYCDRVFQPDDRETPANRLKDGVDFVPMKKWKNGLIELLNIAGTGPILGPIQGILFGPIAFILIPIGCFISGAVHDYMCGMICMREEGKQMPALVRIFLGKGVFNVYNVFICILMLLVGAVFIYTPGDLVVTQLLQQSALPSNPVVWVVYGLIFVYYLIATLFPIDMIIGKIYPVFGAILLLSAVGMFFGIFFNGYELAEITSVNWMGLHPEGLPLLPIFFVTVACGITSGFHSTQATLIARSVQSEHSGRPIFYNMMILEGFIAMIWAAASMGIYAKITAGNLIGVDQSVFGSAAVVGLVAKDLLGNYGGILAIIGVIVLPITSGDTALRSLRLMIAEFLHYDQKSKKNRIILSAVIFSVCAAILIFAKLSAEGFQILWRYFAWANQTIAIFAFAMATVYLYVKKKNYWMTLLPGTFYAFIISTFIVNAKIGLHLPMGISYVIGILFSILYVYGILNRAKKYVRMQE